VDSNVVHFGNVPHPWALRIYNKALAKMAMWFGGEGGETSPKNNFQLHDGVGDST